METFWVHPIDLCEHNDCNGYNPVLMSNNKKKFLLHGFVPKRRTTVFIVFAAIPYLGLFVTLTSNEGFIFLK